MSLGANTKVIESAVFDGTYEILGFVGRGRGSIVYKARRAGELFALKVLVGHAKDPEFNLRRVKREALAMLSCVHPNVIKLIDYVAGEDELCYLVMEFAERGDLRSIVDNRAAALPPEQVLQLMVQVLSGLEAIHRSGIVHRDIKPENLLLDAFGRVKVGDFGVAYFPSEHSYSEDIARGVGTFDYLAPESLEDSVCTPATDVYAAAVTCYQLIAGVLPFGGTTFTEQIANKMSGEILPLQDYLEKVPPGLEDFLNTALCPDPAKRYQSAAEFRHAIVRYLEGSWRSSDSRTVTRTTSREQQLLSEETSQANGSDKAYLLFRRSPRTAKFVSGLFFVFVIIGALFAAVNYDRNSGNAQTADTSIVVEPKSEEALSKVTSTTGFAVLLSSSHAGALKGLLADGDSVPLLLTPGNQGELVLGLGIAGWMPFVLNEQSLNSDRLVVKSAGLSLELRLTENGAEEYALRGTYVEQNSGREGDWYIW